MISRFHKVLRQTKFSLLFEGIKLVLTVKKMQVMYCSATFIKDSRKLLRTGQKHEYNWSAPGFTLCACGCRVGPCPCIGVWRWTPNRPLMLWVLATKSALQFVSGMIMDYRIYWIIQMIYLNHVLRVFVAHGLSVCQAAWCLLHWGCFFSQIIKSYIALWVTMSFLSLSSQIQQVASIPEVFSSQCWMPDFQTWLCHRSDLQLSANCFFLQLSDSPKWSRCCLPTFLLCQVTCLHVIFCVEPSTATVIKSWQKSVERPNDPGVLLIVKPKFTHQRNNSSASVHSKTRTTSFLKARFYIHTLARHFVTSFRDLGWSGVFGSLSFPFSFPLSQIFLDFVSSLHFLLCWLALLEDRGSRMV